MAWVTVGSRPHRPRDASQMGAKPTAGLLSEEEFAGQSDRTGESPPTMLEAETADLPAPAPPTSMAGAHQHKLSPESAAPQAHRYGWRTRKTAPSNTCSTNRHEKTMHECAMTTYRATPSRRPTTCY